VADRPRRCRVVRLVRPPAEACPDGPPHHRHGRAVARQRHERTFRYSLMRRPVAYSTQAPTLAAQRHDPMPRAGTRRTVPAWRVDRIRLADGDHTLGVSPFAQSARRRGTPGDKVCDSALGSAVTSPSQRTHPLIGMVGRSSPNRASALTHLGRPDSSSRMESTRVRTVPVDDGPGPASGNSRLSGSLQGPHRSDTSSSPHRLDAGVDLRDVQIAARHADPRTTMRYDRARHNLDRHPNYILAAYMASGT
jgi:hypothetical protein